MMSAYTYFHQLMIPLAVCILLTLFLLWKLPYKHIFYGILTFLSALACIIMMHYGVFPCLYSPHAFSALETSLQAHFLWDSDVFIRFGVYHHDALWRFSMPFGGRIETRPCAFCGRQLSRRSTL